MICPVCLSQMFQFHDKDIFHCDTCGMNYLGENEINRITTSDTKPLGFYNRQIPSSNSSTLCPKDHYPMKLLQGEAIPQFVTVLQCPTCLGLLVKGHDLAAFKKAQKAKLSYFKNWQIPLPSLHSVLVYSVLVMIGVTTLSLFGNLFTPKTTVSQAKDVIQRINISKTNGQTIIYFTSIVPYSSRITFYNNNNNSVIKEDVISDALTTTHYYYIQGLETSPDIYFKVTLQNGSGIITTDRIPFEVSKK